MKRAFLTNILSFLFLHSIAQDNPKRLNIIVSYSVGLQTFRLHGVETHLDERLRRNMPFSGYLDEPGFKPTVINHVAMATTISKNKKWYLELNADWGRNETTAHGYTADQDGNPYRVRATASFKFLHTGYSIKKVVDLKKWGTLMPSIGFSVNWRTPYTINVSYQVNDKTTNEVLKAGNGVGGSGEIYKYGSPYLLWFFDNPRVGIDYKVRLVSHCYLSLSYSYWWANSYLNELYGLSGYLIKPRTNRITSHNLPNHKDLYSHNISIGLSFSLRK